ncbi:hypothetical protein [Andreprevotia chitinilytica]|uniref:hypothetical protein n=1 Tax=Andreprevotia chitinilytica TaxID=396808 RepID=UPI00146FDCE1|nr:hypothetical protein [Andreprevotia chitinilytica]
MARAATNLSTSRSAGFGMTAKRIPVLYFVAALMFAIRPAAAGTQEQQLLETVRGFYGWALQNGDQTVKLEPRIKDIAGSTRFYLDMTTLTPFTARFMQSGYFAADFPDAVARYYRRYDAQFKTLKQAEFDEMARDGRGPQMDVEDMDIFFCAQEYEYKRKFIQGMKIKSASFAASTAQAVIVSPYKWETTFHFRKVGSRWLIAGYCVFE